jgi:L-threonylcarbamoyladenylate synthase
MNTINLRTTPESEVIAQTVAVLQAGGLVLFPTETTYGAGVNALNPAAVQKLLAYKSRREGKPLSVAVTDLAMAEKYVEVNESARALYARFLPGPVTVVSRGRGVVAPGVESEFGTLGIRIPDYPLILEIVTILGQPITSTSANGSGKKRPYSIEDALSQLSEKQKSLIDLVLDAGELPHNPPSTVIDTTLSAPVVFRQGEVEVAENAGQSTQLKSHSETETKNIAKRLLLKHWNEVKERGLVIGLNGSLGMGKTIFVKGLAEFLQITDTITSPTYTYVEEYEFDRHGVRGQLFHLDIWKIESPEEMSRIGFDQMLKPSSVVVVEWVSTMKVSVTTSIQKTGAAYLEIEFQSQPTAPEKRTLVVLE